MVDLQFCRLIVLRTKPETPSGRLEKIAAALESNINQRTVQVILGQRSDNPAEVILQCTASQRQVRFLNIQCNKLNAPFIS